MKTKYIALAMVAPLLCACHKNTESAPDEEITVDVAEVVTDSVTLSKEYPGMITADNGADIVARVNGVLLTTPYNGGDYVRKGQLIATIDPTTYQNAVTEAEAALATARSNNAYAEEHYEAVAAAFAHNAVSKMEVAQALSDRDNSRASINSAQAQLADARRRLSYCTITAPMSGRITISNYSCGAYIPGENSPVTIAHVYADDIVDAKFSIEDDSFLRMFLNPNNRHLIDYTAIPISFGEKLPHTYTADLSNIDPNVTASTGTITITSKIQNPYGELRDGMYATVKLPYKVDPKATLIRDASISTDQLGKYVYVVNDSNKVVYTPIKVGDLVNDTMRVVESGLKPGQKYITSALLKVRDGMQVKTRTTK